MRARPRTIRKRCRVRRRRASGAGQRAPGSRRLHPGNRGLGHGPLRYREPPPQWRAGRSARPVPGRHTQAPGPCRSVVTMSQAFEARCPTAAGRPWRRGRLPCRRGQAPMQRKKGRPGRPRRTWTERRAGRSAAFRAAPRGGPCSALIVGRSRGAPHRDQSEGIRNRARGRHRIGPPGGRSRPAPGISRAIASAMASAAQRWPSSVGW